MQWKWDQINVKQALLDESGQAIESTCTERSGIQEESCICVWFLFLCSVEVWFQALISCQVNNDVVIFNLTRY